MDMFVLCHALGIGISLCRVVATTFLTKNLENLTFKANRCCCCLFVFLGGGNGKKILKVPHWYVSLIGQFTLTGIGRKQWHYQP